jgi:hypothetical protein
MVVGMSLTLWCPSQSYLEIVIKVKAEKVFFVGLEKKWGVFVGRARSWKRKELSSPSPNCAQGQHKKHGRGKIPSYNEPHIGTRCLFLNSFTSQH